ncbi:MAG: hypothetical protein AABX82_06255 [Nanoarchaeota archaeon]
MSELQSKRAFWASKLIESFLAIIITILAVFFGTRLGAQLRPIFLNPDTQENIAPEETCDPNDTGLE